MTASSSTLFSATPLPPSAPQSGEGSVEAWREVRADEDIQYAPLQLPERQPAEQPDWLRSLLESLADISKAINGWLSGNWDWLQWALIVIGVAIALYVLYRLIGPGLSFNLKRQRHTSQTNDWTPSAAEANALLSDADELAAQGDYDGATHLLLLRSVNQIAQARPDLVEPSSTARELARLSQLPQSARQAFAVITERVERSLFALRGLDREDWEAARGAYATFAVQNLPEHGQ